GAPTGVSFAATRPSSRLRNSRTLIGGPALVASRALSPIVSVSSGGAWRAEPTRQLAPRPFRPLRPFRAFNPLRLIHLLDLLRLLDLLQLPPQRFRLVGFVLRNQVAVGIRHPADGLADLISGREAVPLEIVGHLAPAHVGIPVVEGSRLTGGVTPAKAKEDQSLAGGKGAVERGVRDAQLGEDGRSLLSRCHSPIQSAGFAVEVGLGGPGCVAGEEEQRRPKQACQVNLFSPSHFGFLLARSSR